MGKDKNSRAVIIGSIIGAIAVVAAALIPVYLGGKQAGRNEVGPPTDPSTAAAVQQQSQTNHTGQPANTDFYQYFLDEPAFGRIIQWVEAADSPGQYRGAQLILAQDFSPLPGWTMHTPKVPAGKPGDSFAAAGTKVTVYIPDGEDPFDT